MSGFGICPDRPQWIQCAPKVLQDLLLDHLMESVPMLAYADDMFRFSWKCWLLQHVFFKMALRRSGCGIDGQASVDTLHVIRSAMQDRLLALLMDGVSPCCGVCR